MRCSCGDLRAYVRRKIHEKFEKKIALVRGFALARARAPVFLPGYAGVNRRDETGGTYMYIFILGPPPPERNDFGIRFS